MAQFVELRLINILHFQTMIASKAARMVLAAPGKFSRTSACAPRMAPRPVLFSARASYIAGFGGAANVLLGRQRYGIPIVGTMANLFVQVHDDEMVAFENFARARPEGVILLIVTTPGGRTKGRGACAGKARRPTPRHPDPRRPHRQRRSYKNGEKVRAILDAGGVEEVIILVSGGINEDVLLKMAAAKAPIDGFGVPRPTPRSTPPRRSRTMESTAGRDQLS